MQRRELLRGGSIAALIALTGKANAKSEFVNAAAAPGSPDLVVLDPSSSQFQGLRQGFNRRWSAPNVERIFIPLTESGAAQALQEIWSAP